MGNTEFKPGDRVVGIDGWYKGRKGTIVTGPPYILTVRFDSNLAGAFEYAAASDSLDLLDEFEEWVKEVREANLKNK